MDEIKKKLISIRQSRHQLNQLGPKIDKQII